MHLSVENPVVRSYSCLEKAIAERREEADDQSSTAGLPARPPADAQKVVLGTCSTQHSILVLLAME